MSTETQVGVGSAIWLLDDLYKQPRCVSVEGESSTHWEVPYWGKPLKVPRTPREQDAPDVRFVSRPVGSGVRVFLSEKALDDHLYVQQHRHKIVDMVQATKDADVLRAIAKLVGYKAGEETRS